jgi:hypothetical protein
LVLIHSRPVRARFVVEIIVHWVRAIGPVLSNGIADVLRSVNPGIGSLQFDFAGLRSFPFSRRRVSVGYHRIKPQTRAAMRTFGVEPTPRNYHDFTAKRESESFGLYQQSVPTLRAVILNDPGVHQFHDAYSSISDTAAAERSRREILRPETGLRMTDACGSAARESGEKAAD